MRRANAVISMAVLALFLLHAVMGGFVTAGFMDGGSVFMKGMAWLMVTLIIAHVAIAVKLTADTLIALKRSGTSYFKENKLFWIRRISGVAVMIFILFHIMIFLGNNDGTYRLNFFGGAQLASQILMVLSLGIHIVTNAKPMLLGFGTKSWKELGTDLALILTGILLFAGICFVVYYLRWRMI
ncbi:pilus assembly protein PilX [Ruminococcus sp.]|uniref:pilus assembly protein PilX n=1 Tax=Ruminococcus sp. TaxID=41978 RepID=UPI0025EFC004|nr:pilus assembly protein PilX [Ruminococcus sp.]MBQ8966086.1 pilus assembly protein PilX [Ruminococcus sp.]